MRPGSYPLSPIQQGMLFHWLSDRHSGTDVEQIIGRLDEALDPARFEAAWQHAVQAFSTLRTSFEWEGLPEPVQRVEPEASVPVTVSDLGALAADAAEARIAEFLRTDRARGFDLACAPAMRVALFQMDGGRCTMVWTFHHILIDGRAFEIILDTVFAAYEGTAHGDVPDRPYREYVEWIERQDDAEARRFWRDRLEGFTATTPLPASHAPTSSSDRFGQKETSLSRDATERLREVAATHALSLNTIVMSAWALVLSRYSGECDIVFGATKTTRRGTIPDADSIVGQFLATIPMRVRVDMDRSVAEFLKAVRSDWTSLRGAEHVPLVEIKQETALPPGAPLFETLVVFENYQFGTRLRARGGNWSTRQFSILEQTSFPLALMAYGDDALALKIDFDGRRFSDRAIDRLLGQLTTILASWSETVDAPLWATAMLPPDERAVLLDTWNATVADYPADTPLAALVEAQVARTPDAPAVTFGDAVLTYRELNARANQLARALRDHGAGPDRLVGICVQRSAEMMIALLAAIKSGAAYVPLDPFLPRERIAYMMRDSDLVAVVTDSAARPHLPEVSCPILSLDDASWRANGDTNLDVAVSPEHLAVVIYTSGSTGQPKGVQVPRRALINLLWSMRTWLGLTSADRLLAVTTISFDIAGADIWLPWLVGASTIVASREDAADGARLRALIDAHDVTFLQATPVTWRLLFGAGWEGKRDMQCVCTGEAMPPEIASRLTPIVRRLWNLYGPTETTIWSTGYAVDDGDAPVLIGRPIANTQCYILDERAQLLPIGAAGELYIAGDGVARGYLSRPDLTAERFLADPFSTKPGARMYRTGDLARYNPDGSIVCLGRTDHQVKIRGFRVELGEIESLLKQHPAVAEAVVVAREDAQGDRRLVAYVVARGDLPSVAEMRAYLKRQLPDYMVPAALVALDAMPLTANGKIDRRALPAPDVSADVTARAVIRPRTYVEKQLSEIWEEIFSLPQVSVDDNFFDLGGHSILALRLMGRITQVFGKQLQLNTLFESPTLAELARHIESDDRTVGQHTLVSIQASGSRPPIFWIPGGAALGMFSLRHVVTRLGPDQPVYGLGSAYPKSLDDVETVEQRARNYLELIRRVQPHGPYCFAGFCAGGRVAFEMAQQLHAAGERVAFIGMINCWFPNYPAGRASRLRFKSQRLRHQLREARMEGTGLIGYARAKIAARRAAHAERQQLDAVRAQVEETGFKQAEGRQNQVLLNAVIERFDHYQPRHYPGSVSLFISDDEQLTGVHRDLDPRFAWAHYAAAHEIRTFPGGHEAVLEMPYAIDFAETLKIALEAALARSEPGARSSAA